MYSLKEAARLLPSCQPGKNVHVRTLKKWVQAGRLKAFRNGIGWFVHGAELLRLLSADQAPEWHGRTPVERRRDIEAAEAELREMGVL